MKGFRAKPGERISGDEMRELMEKAVRDATEVLSKDQEAKLLEHSAKKRAERAAKPRARSYSSEQIREMSKLSKIQSKLMRLSFDTELADELELTPAQSEKLSQEIKMEQLKRKHGDEFALINGLAEEYGLDDKAKAKLSEKIEEVRKEYYDDWMALKKKSMKAIITELPRKHREEAEAAVRDFVEKDPREEMSRSRLLIPTRN